MFTSDKSTDRVTQSGKLFNLPIAAVQDSLDKHTEDGGTDTHASAHNTHTHAGADTHILGNGTHRFSHRHTHTGVCVCLRACMRVRVHVKKIVQSGAVK